MTLVVHTHVTESDVIEAIRSHNLNLALIRLAILLALCAAPALASTSTEQGGVDAAICAYLDPLRIDATLFTAGGTLSPPRLEGIRTRYDGPPVVPGIVPSVAPVPAPWPVSSLVAGLAMLAVAAWKVGR